MRCVVRCVVRCVACLSTVASQHRVVEVEGELKAASASLHSEAQRALEFEGLAASARKALQDYERQAEDEKTSLRQQLAARTSEVH